LTLCLQFLDSCNKVGQAESFRPFPRRPQSQRD
jgi:hypothetical protein